MTLCLFWYISNLAKQSMKILWGMSSMKSIPSLKSTPPLTAYLYRLDTSWQTSRCAKMLRNGRVQSELTEAWTQKQGLREGRVMAKWAAPGVPEPAPGALGADRQEVRETSSFIHSHCPSANFGPSSTLTSGNKAMHNGGLPAPGARGWTGLGEKAGSPLKEVLPLQRRPKRRPERQLALSAGGSICLASVHA